MWLLTCDSSQWAGLFTVVRRYRGLPAARPELNPDARLGSNSHRGSHSPIPGSLSHSPVHGRSVHPSGGSRILKQWGTVDLGFRGAGMAVGTRVRAFQCLTTWVPALGDAGLGS
ncbi:hypothetical protein JCM9957A_18060 [Kineosporia succinea]|uniref:Uncharacterized protein n=1 Tax=Kineosporia succinea TaxID=84632 RepID=A0ABT9NZU0_9ACTN|nr:hypothetical protein [Kineosporia succinea]